MSLVEIERFANDLKLREPLRNRAFHRSTPTNTPTRAKGRRRSETLLERAVAFATLEGFRFNIEDVRAYLKAKATAQGEALTNAYIDSLPAAGFFPFVFFSEIYLVRAGVKAPRRAANARAKRSPNRG
jgi:uncharacterized Rmd1/YagE family protein